MLPSWSGRRHKHSLKSSGKQHAARHLGQVGAAETTSGRGLGVGFDNSEGDGYQSLYGVVLGYRRVNRRDLYGLVAVTREQPLECS